MFVAHAIFPVSINSYGSRTSNICIFPAFNIAFSSVRLISVQFSRGVVDVFLFGQCTLTAGFVMPASCRKALVVYSVHAFFTGTWRHVRFVAAPTNRASTIIVKTVKILTTTNFLWREPCNISLREYSTEWTNEDLQQRQNTWDQSWLLPFMQVFLYHARETLGMGSYYTMRPRYTPLISNIKRPPFCNLATKVGFLERKRDLCSFEMWYEALPPFIIMAGCITITGYGMRFIDYLFLEGKVNCSALRCCVQASPTHLILSVWY